MWQPLPLIVSKLHVCPELLVGVLVLQLHRLETAHLCSHHTGKAHQCHRVLVALSLLYTDIEKD